MTNCYKRNHQIKLNSLQTNELSLLLSFVFYESLHKEEWKEIENLNGRYFISNYGRVLSLCNNGYKLLKPFVCGNGYYYVDLRKDNEDIKCRINRLVAQAFIKKDSNNQLIVHHKDFNKKNNIVSNLCWLSYQNHSKIHKNLTIKNIKENFNNDL